MVTWMDPTCACKLPLWLASKNLNVLSCCTLHYIAEVIVNSGTFVIYECGTKSKVESTSMCPIPRAFSFSITYQKCLQLIMPNHA